MKKYLIIPVIFILSLFISSCDDTTTDPEEPTPTGKGSVYFTTSPAGAAIWEGNTNTNKVTPDSVTGLTVGVHNFTLKLPDYRDTTIAVTIEAGKKKSVQVAMRSSADLRFFNNPVRIFETNASGATEFSGLDLSTGTAISMRQGAAGRENVDFYYSSTGYIIVTASQATGLTRQTFFKVGTGNELNDHVPAPTKDNTWVQQIPDNTTSYVYIYDQDKHYSKIIFTRGGGTSTTNPSYVDITWIYNNTVDDKRF